MKTDFPVQCNHHCKKARDQCSSDGSQQRTGRVKEKQEGKDDAHAPNAKRQWDKPLLTDTHMMIAVMSKAHPTPDKVQWRDGNPYHGNRPPQQGMQKIWRMMKRHKE